MSLTPESENEPPEPSDPDVVDVIARAADIENVINQVIVGYCKPRKEAWEFMWSITRRGAAAPFEWIHCPHSVVGHRIEMPKGDNQLFRLAFSIAAVAAIQFQARAS
jgi:hypothetical protein